MRAAGGGLAHFFKKQHVGFDALGVEDAGGQPEDGVQAAFVHQVAAHVGAYAGFKQHVVGQHHGGAATVFEVAHDVLQKGQLLVAGDKRQVISRGAAAAFGGAKGRVAQHHVAVGQGAACAGQGVAQVHHALVVAFHAVQQAVHQRQAPGAGDQLHANEGVVALELALALGQVVEVVGAFFDGAVGRNQKAAGACGGVLHGFARLGLDDLDDGVNQRARGEVLACAAFGFAGVLLQQAFVQIAQAVALGAEPVNAVQAFDELLEVARLLQAGLRVGVDGGNEGVGALAELEQRFFVVQQQVHAAAPRELAPAGVVGQLVLVQHAAFGAFVLHFDEEQQHQLGDVVAVVDAVVAQHVAQVPEFLDDVLGGHGFLECREGNGPQAVAKWQGMGAVVQHDASDEVAARQRLQAFEAFEVLWVDLCGSLDFDADDLAQRVFQHKVHLHLVFVAVM